MMNFTKNKKVLFGLAVSLVLAMAVGSFALGEAQTEANPQVQTQSLAAANDDDTGDFVVDDMSKCLFSNGVLKIYEGASPIISMKPGVTSTTQRIEVKGESTITLNGVNIDRSNEQQAWLTDPLVIDYNGNFDVTILLSDDSENFLIGSAVGLHKGSSNTGALTIGVPEGAKGTGQLTATGGKKYPGIGSDFTNNINITGGIITATGGRDGGAGIGGGLMGNGDKITITGGIVEATGRTGAAGIGGGVGGEGNEIKITGGVVTATGGLMESKAQGTVYKFPGAGIGGGASQGQDSGIASKNSISGNAIVFAASGGENTYTGEMKEALQGFDEASQGSITGGITFTGVGTAFDSDGIATKVAWDEGRMEYCDSFTISKSVEFPGNFNVADDKELIVGAGATLSVADGATLQNEGKITVNQTGKIECLGSGTVTTLLNYDPQGGSIKTNDDNYITYQDVSGVNQYETLPEAIKEGYDLEGWHTEKTGKEDTKVEPTDNVLLNQHMLYANWVEPAPPTPPTPTPPEPEPTPTPPEPGPEPTPTPEPTPDPSVNPDGGDGSGSGASSKTGDPFMGGIALALLGVATTGAVLVRKRK